MQIQRPPRPPRRPHDAGFTIIELLIVILVIGILIALLLPALGGARQSAQIAQVKSEISALESAITRFRVDFNIDPPSGIVLCENPNHWTSPPAGLNAGEPARSRALIRQMWPQFDFSMARDLNFNGSTDDVFELGGQECLVFFLGGVGQLHADLNNNGQFDQGDGVVPNGFAKNPLDPFATRMTDFNGTRQGPYFEYNVARLIPSPPTPPLAPTRTGFFGYVDPLPGQTQPYIYASSYSGKGYRPIELGAGGTFSDVYRQGTASTSPPWNATKFQIVSPGMDHLYGTGGSYLPDQADTLLINARMDERDNITNFHTRTLSTK